MIQSQTLQVQQIMLWILFIFLPLTCVFLFARYILLAVCIILIFFVFFNRRLCEIVLILKSGEKNTGVINILFYTLITWFIIIGFIIDPQFDCIVRIIQIIGCFLSFNLGTSQYWNKKTISLVQKVLTVIAVSVIIHWGMEGFPLAAYSFIYPNPNIFGSQMLVWLFFILMGETNLTKAIFFIVFGFVMLYVSSARSAILAFCLYLMVYSFLNHDLKKNGPFQLNTISKWNSIFILFLFSMIAFIFIYVKLLNTDFGNILQDVSREYSGKNFYSGRHIIWENLILLISEKPFTGFGLAAQPSDYMNLTLSSHNVFLQTALQSGIVGLLLLLLIVKRIYTNCLYHSDSKFALYSIAIIYGMIVHESFEITLTQNLSAQGLQFWFLFGLGCINQDKNESCEGQTQ